MRFSFKFISLFFFVLFNISSSYALIISQDLSKRMNISNNINLINNPKIGIVDFRNILKESITMKKLGKEFLQFERRLNEKIKKQEKILRDKEKLRDILASIIKTISKEKKIDFVVLKENIFLINNFDLDLTNEALKKFDEKTFNLKIQFVKKKDK